MQIAVQYRFFSITQGIFPGRDYMVDYKASFNKFKKIQVISSVFSNLNGIKLEINNKENWERKKIFNTKREVINAYIKKAKSASQAESIGRYTAPLHTAERRTTINLKMKNNQNCQKIEL